MRPGERIILFLSVLLQTMLLVWCITLQNRIYETREALIKLGNSVVSFMKETNKTFDNNSQTIKYQTEAIGYLNQAIRNLSGISK